MHNLVSYDVKHSVIFLFFNYLDTEELFPVASSTSFFTDMHHLLKVMSIGNVRSACHHRLRFLEEVIFSTTNVFWRCAFYHLFR